MTIVRTLTLTAVLALTTAGTATAFWGRTGHRLVGSVAAEAMHPAMPAFFRNAAPQLAYLNYEPDRWRSDSLTAMDEAFKYDHYVDLENVPDGALDAPDRYEFLQALYEAGLEEPERDAGFLSFRILELQQRLTSGFARWRTAESPDERAWIEQRIINDAGVLGHYVADASQPHHTTIHFNGWARDTPNPEGYTTSRDFHWRFESLYVDSHITQAEVADALRPGVPVLDDVRTSVLEYILEGNRLVERLYQLEKEYGFAQESTAPEPEAFTIERLAAAADMLAALWHTAWVESAALTGE